MTYKIIKPLGNSIVVKAHQRDKVGGIYLPDKRKEKEWSLEVICVGPDVKTIKSGDYIMCQPIQIVFFTNWIGIEEGMGIITEDKVLGIAI